MISIDPGTEVTGVALWSYDKLLRHVVELTAPPSLSWHQRCANIVEQYENFLGRHRYANIGFAVIELPQIYARSRSQGDPNDLVKVAYLAGQLTAFVKSVRVVQPREWKGQRPKEVCKRLSKAALLSGELAVIPRGLGLDGWDAIGIGLQHHGRAFR